jgi:hypothetical protein
MGWLVVKHFFSHNNIIFFFFSLSVFPLVSGCTLYPYSRFYSSPNSNFLPVGIPTLLITVLFDSWDPRLSPTTSSLFFGSAKAATLSWLALYYSVALPYTYYADSTNRLCDFRILEFISFLGFCFLPTHGCSAVATGKYPPNTIPNKYFCIKMSHFDYDKHYID